MALNLGSLTILASDSSDEVDSVAPLANLPAGAFEALRRFFAIRIIERGDNIVVRAPTERQKSDLITGILHHGRGTVLLEASLNGLVGGILVTGQRTESGGYHFEVSAHT